MQVFSKILVCVDFSHREDAVVGHTGQELLRTALHLAQKTSAQLSFFSVLPRDESRRAEKVLSGLAAQAEAAGVRADTKFVEGVAWGEIIRQVQRGPHDLVLIGVAEMKAASSGLFGSTARTLLQRCPCPIWIAVPAAEPRLRNILVASDLTVGSENALRLGVDLAAAIEGTAHVLHVVDYPLDHHWSTGDADPWTTYYHQRVRGEAEQNLREQVQRIGSPRDDSDLPIHVVGRTAVPDIEIVHYIQNHEIDLVVLGTSGRGGVMEILFGNTVTQVLVEQPCSILVVKSDGTVPSHRE